MRRWIFAALIVSLFLVTPASVKAAQPEVFSIVEGRDATNGRPVIMVFGTRLTAFKTWSFHPFPIDEDTEVVLKQTSRSRTALVFSLPGTWGPADAQDFRLTLSTGKADQHYDISLRFGKAEAESVGTEALSTTTRDDVDDASLLGGEAPSYYLNAGNLTGTLAAERFSAYADLQAEDCIGTGSGQVAGGTHNHDAAYAALNHDHDGRYDLKMDSVAWSRLTGVPDGFADGIDDVTTYSAGTGLALNGTTFSVAFNPASGLNGTSSTAARADHLHDGTYLRMDAAQNSLTNTLTVYRSTGTNPLANFFTTSVSDPLTCTAYSTTGNTVGVTGVTYSSSGVGVYGLAYSGSNSKYGVFGESVGTGYGVYGKGPFTGVCGEGNVGVHAKGLDNNGSYGLYAESGTGGNAVVADLKSANSGSSTAYDNIAVFRANGSNKARITMTGLGIFNGGTATSGADVAESVVAADATTLEPGDVLVIDATAPRRFARSAEAESRLVAGVYATRPGVLLRNGDVSEGIPVDEVPLAVVGIVPTKVCDEGGPIAIGDLLVTASMPGHAKKAGEEPMAGTVLGKALGALDKGDGVIEVLLMAR